MWASPEAPFLHVCEVCHILAIKKKITWCDPCFAIMTVHPFSSSDSAWTLMTSFWFRRYSFISSPESSWLSSSQLHMASQVRWVVLHRPTMQNKWIFAFLSKWPYGSSIFSFSLSLERNFPITHSFLLGSLQWVFPSIVNLVFSLLS